MTGDSATSRGRVYVVDDDEDVRLGLTMLLESAGFTVSGFSGADAFIEGHDGDQAACLILDVNMPGIDGLELQERLDQGGSMLPIIFLTGQGTVPDAVKALKLGAVDFLQKPLEDDELLITRVTQAIEQGAANLQAAGEREDAAARIARLTPRERQVMVQVCSGNANKVIAIELGISERTVELHRGRVMKKLGVRTVPELIRLREMAGE